jgi:hypothetical protein
MNDHQQTSQCVHAQRHKTPLTERIEVFERDRHIVAKRLLGVREAHAMLAKVAARLGWIELELHALVCISDAYCLGTESQCHASPT